MHWYCQVYRFQIMEKHIDSIKWKMRWYCQVYRFQIMEKHIDSIKWKMRWYCQVYRFQIMEKHIDSIKWKMRWYCQLLYYLSGDFILMCFGNTVKTKENQFLSFSRKIRPCWEKIPVPLIA